MDLVEQVHKFDLSNIHTCGSNISLIMLFSLIFNYAKPRLSLHVRLKGLLVCAQQSMSNHLLNFTTDKIEILDRLAGLKILKDFVVFSLCDLPRIKLWKEFRRKKVCKLSSNYIHFYEYFPSDVSTHQHPSLLSVVCAAI